MTGKTIGAALLAVVCCAALPPAADGSPLAPAVGVRTGAGLELSGAEPFPVKPQGTLSAALFAEARLNRRLGLGLAAGAHYTAPSDLSEGFQYRGHWGLDLRPYLSVRWLEHPASPSLELGLGNLLGPVIRYDGYLLTYRYFFFMGLGVEPYLELHFLKGSPGGRHSLVISLPLDLYFRPELSLSAAGALVVSWKLYLPRPPLGGSP